MRFTKQKEGDISMGIFNKQVKFISAVCPECQGHLELDASRDIAFCLNCGARCIVENAPKRDRKVSGLNAVLAFIERRDDLRRQDRHERQKKKEQKEKEQRESMKKSLWIYIAVSALIITLCFVMSILENQGII